MVIEEGHGTFCGHWQTVQEVGVRIVSYRMCLTDETCVEAVHRDISREGARVHYRTFPVIASQLRLKQNLQDIVDNGHCYKELVEMNFAKVTSIVRRDPAPRDRGRPVRGMSLKTLCDAVYLCGRQKFIHFGLFEDKFNALMPLEKPSVGISKWTRLRVDHLVAITKEKMVCSLAEVTDEALQAVAKLDGHCEDAVALFRRSTERTVFFQVMQLNLKMKKFMRGGSMKATIRDMSMPVQLQFLDIVSDGGDGVVVRPDGGAQCRGLGGPRTLASLPPGVSQVGHWRRSGARHFGFDKPLSLDCKHGH